jgi:hypothetical protein
VAGLPTILPGRAMVIDRETWELAQLLLDRRPETAFKIACERAREALQRKDDASSRTWLLIANVIREVRRAPTRDDRLN